MDKFPQEIKDIPQWAVCGFHPGTSAEKQPFVWDDLQGDMVPLRKDGTQYHASNIHLLMSYEDAANCVRHYASFGHNLMLGFYLMPSDPFCCIDMDVKKEWTPAQVAEAGARYQKIVEIFHSYTEISRSGNGLHLWVYGIPQPGKRRDGVEVYSQYRYIICTGNHWDISPLSVAGKPGSESEIYIAEKIELLRSEMNDINVLDGFVLQELTEEEFEADPYALSDMDLYVRASEAANGSLFVQLWEGRWSADHIKGDERAFPSQSEAEFALIDILAFYTKYNFQVRRLFMMSALSARYDDNRRGLHEKIKRPYHLDLMIKKRRSDEAKQALEITQISQNNVNRAIAEMERRRLASTPERPATEFLATDGQFNVEVDNGLDWPPGVAGEVARYMFGSSLRPIKDISILACLSLLSGICGKSWNTHTKGGLNNYFILIARSGLGKDAFRTSMQRVLQQVEDRGGKDGMQLFGARGFVDTARYASEQALMKAVICPDGEMNKLSFLHYIDEIGKFIGDLANGYGKAPDLAHAMLSLYSSSDFFARADGLKYSNKDNNHAGGRLAAYSFAGECTPKDFYNQLTEQMMAGGFMSRVIAWECTAPRPLENKNNGYPMSDELTQLIGQLVMQSITIAASTEPCIVQLEPDVERFYDQLDIEVNNRLNFGADGEEEQDEVVRQAYNRRVFKILRIACLLAVADNCFKPIVNMQHFTWAMNFVDTANERMLDKHKQGEVGADGINREKLVLNKVLKIITENKGRDWKRYPLLSQNYVVTKSDIRVNTIESPAFKDGRADKTIVMDNTLKSLCDLGALRFVTANELAAPPFYMGEGRPFRGAAYLVDIQKVEELLENM